MSSFDSNAAGQKLSTKLAALFRGKRERAVHIPRANRDDGAWAPSIFCEASVIAPSIIEGWKKVGRPLSQEDVVYDIGCGHGEVLIELAKSVGCKCVGIELDAVHAKIARRRVEESSMESLVKIIHGDAMDRSFLARVKEEATVLYFFLLPSFLGALSPHLPKDVAVCALKYEFPERKYALAVQLDGNMPGLRTRVGKKINLHFYCGEKNNPHLENEKEEYTDR